MNDQPRPASRFLVVGAVIVSALVSALLVAYVMDARIGGQPLPAAYTAAAPVQNTSDPEVMGMLASTLACRQAARALLEPGDKLRASWAKHRGAHHDAHDGKITEAQMRQVWKVTLAAWMTEDPAFGQARDALADACKE
jgi:hypothetical protein